MCSSRMSNAMVNGFDEYSFNGVRLQWESSQKLFLLFTRCKYAKNVCVLYVREKNGENFFIFIYFYYYILVYKRKLILLQIDVDCV